MQSSMNKQDIIKLAMRGAIVRWYPSKKIEVLRWSRERKIVFARGLLDKKEHPLVFKRDEYLCEELDPKMPLTVGEMAHGCRGIGNG